MRLSKKIFTCLLVLLSSVLLLSTVGVMTKTSSVSADSVIWSDIQVEDQYYLGDGFAVPARTLTVNGTPCAKVYSIITSPSGNATLKDSIIFSEAGKYKLAYTGVVNNKTYKTEQTIQVFAKVAKVSSENSNFWYGKNEEYSKNTSGLNVTLSYGDTLYFESTMDLRNVTKNDSLVKLFFTPEIRRQLDMEVLNIVFTDIEDPNNYIRVKIHSSSSNGKVDHPYSYILAGGDGQAIKGYEKGWDRLHVNNEWGTPFRHTFYGDDTHSVEGQDQYNLDQYIDDTYLDIRYDADEKAIYGKDVRSAEPIIVIDFDDPKYYGSNLWGGLVSGKVKMEMYGELYANTLSKFCVSYVRGLDLSKGVSSDETPPDVTILYPETGVKIPTAKVGYYYPIFNADISDNYFNVLDEKISVWYKESESAKFSVEVKDGAFKVDKEGTYIIRYKITDGYGNVTIKEVEVLASADVPEISLTLGDGTPAQINTGGHIDVVNTTMTGGTGSLNLEYTYTFNDGERVSITKKGFNTDKAGIYKIYYTVTDYVGQVAEKFVSVNVVDSEYPVFGSAPIVEKTYIAGSTYFLDEYYAKVYNQGEIIDVLTTVTVTDNGGTRAVTPESGFVPSVANSGDTIKFTYTATYNDKTSTKEVLVPVISNAGGIDLTRYFIQHGITLTKTKDYTTVTATEADGGFTFIRAMYVEDVSIVFTSLTDKKTFSGITLKLEDSKDSDVSISIDLLNRENGTAYRIGGKTNSFPSNIGFALGTEFTLKYNAEGLTVNGINIPVNFTDLGKEFRGFPSGRAYISFEYIGADTTGNAAVNLTTICGQAITSTNRDKIVPRIFIMEDLNYTVDKGAYVNVPKAISDDVICPNVTFTVSVKDSSGNALTDINGLSLNNVPAGINYTFQVTAYGQYSITFTSKDTNNQTLNTPISVNVEDSEPPRINFTDVFKETIKKGETIIIPDFTVSDNNTPASSISKSLFIRTADGLLVSLTGNSNSLKTRSTGVYQILISVGDSSGNILLYRKNITVTN